MGGAILSYPAQPPSAAKGGVIDYIRSFSYDPTLPDEAGRAAATPTAATATTSTCPQDPVNPFAWDDTAAIQAGEAIYQERCNVCHGADGSGGLPNTPDFTASEVTAALKADPQPALCALIAGEGAIRASGTCLSEEHIWQLLTFPGLLAPSNPGMALAIWQSRKEVCQDLTKHRYPMMVPSC